MSDETVKINVVIQQEFEVPADILGETAIASELKNRGEDHFWTHWPEYLDNNPPTKDDLSVVSVAPPHVIDGERRCTDCGASVEDEPYERYLFHTCAECAEEGG